MNKCFAIASGRGWSFPRHMEKVDIDGENVCFRRAECDLEPGMLMLAPIGPREQLVPVIAFDDNIGNGICFYFEAETDEGYKTLDLISLPKTVNQLFKRWEGEITVYTIANLTEEEKQKQKGVIALEKYLKRRAMERIAESEIQ